MSVPSIRHYMAFTILAIASVCCSDGKRPWSNVSGKVLFNGVPVPGGMVSIVAADDTNIVSGLPLQESGDFSGQAPVGKVKVSVLTEMYKPAEKSTRSSKSNGPSGYLAKTAGSNSKIGTKYVAIPAKYENIKESGLEYEIKPGSNTLTIELTGDLNKK